MRVLVQLPPGYTDNLTGVDVGSNVYALYAEDNAWYEASVGAVYPASGTEGGVTQYYVTYTGSLHALFCVCFLSIHRLINGNIDAVHYYRAYIEICM